MFATSSGRPRRCGSPRGVQAPTPSWGSMLADGRNHLAASWWFATFPGLAISVATLGVNLLGDGLRDLFDPRLRE